MLFMAPMAFYYEAIGTLQMVSLDYKSFPNRFELLNSLAVLYFARIDISE
jgi:hypothetical protein